MVTDDDGGWSVEVDVASPDASVRIRASRRGDVAVQVDGLYRHTDASLAVQVGAAARLALARLQRAVQGPPAADRLTRQTAPGPVWM